MEEDDKWFKFFLLFVENAPKMTEDAQNTVARYIDYQTHQAVKIDTDFKDLNI